LIVNTLIKRKKILEWLGVLTAIFYSLLIAFNIGLEFIGFSLLLFSAILLGIWAFICNHRGILLLQIFYASAALIGMYRWF
tara:strand:+ start:111 stop:353 length:243 start_codon:yes stop_codon:yes gene_type:complete